LFTAKWTAPTGIATVDYLVVGSGGGGGKGYGGSGGGGGAGGAEFAGGAGGSGIVILKLN